MGLNRVIVEFGKGALIYGIPASLYTRALKKNVRGSLAVGTFYASYYVVNGIIELRKKELNHRVKEYKQALAAAIATFLMLKIDPRFTKWSMITSYLFIKAMRYLVPPQWNYKYAPVVLLCSASAQIFSSLIMAPEDLTDSARNSFSKRIEISSEKLMRIGVLTDNTCKSLHNDVSCKLHLTRIFINDFRRGFRIYGIMAMVRAARGIITRRINIPQILQPWLRSSFFYTIFTTLALSSICISNKYTPGNNSRLKIFLHSWIGGLALLIEPSGNRADVFNYYGSHALDSAYLTIYRKYLPIFKKYKYIHQQLMILLWMIIFSILANNGFVDKITFKRK